MSNNTKLQVAQNVVNVYRGYYHPDESGTSIYDGRFGEFPVPARELEMLSVAALRAEERAEVDAHGDKVLRLLDYGCGDGRYLRFYQELADELSRRTPAVKLEVVGYDVSDEGLDVFKNRLLKMEFSERMPSQFVPFDDNATPSGKDGYVGAHLTKGNLSFRLVHGHVADSIEYIEDIVSPYTAPVNMTMCMFGVLSHIPGQRGEPIGISQEELEKLPYARRMENPFIPGRQDIMALFKKITHGEVVLTVPGQGMFQQEQEEADSLRQQGIIDPRIPDKGDILYYVRDGKGEIVLDGDQQPIRNYYHVYTEEELKRDMEAAGLSTEFVGVASVRHPATISHNQLAWVKDGQMAQVYEVEGRTTEAAYMSGQQPENDHHLVLTYEQYVALQQAKALLPSGS